jgi:hypothetical protein
VDTEGAFEGADFGQSCKNGVWVVHVQYSLLIGILEAEME